MTKVLPTLLLLALFAPAALAQTDFSFRPLAGHWEGTLEYLDYSSEKRVRLKTYITITPSADGRAADFATVYDDFGRIVKSTSVERIDAAARKYFAGATEYAVETSAPGRLVLLGSGEDGERVEPIRKTYELNGDALTILKETRTPWRFRNRLTLRRAALGALAPRPLTTAAAKEDFAALVRVLKELHPGLYRYQTPAVFESTAARFAARLDRPFAEGEFFARVAEFVAAIRCGHTYLNPFNQNALVRERLFGGRTYLPFYFDVVDGRLVVTADASGRNLARGSELAKINGIPARRIIARLLTVATGDGRATLDHRLESLSLTRFRAERYALFDLYFPLLFPFEGEKFAIEAVDFATGKKISFTAPALTKAERTAAIEKSDGPAPTYDDGWKFEVRDERTAYLKIANSITWRLKKIKFKEFLADAFRELRARRVPNLIVDLRGNDGGDMQIGYELARYLAPRRLPPYAAGRRLVRNVAARPDLLGLLDTYSEELKSSLKNGLPADSYRALGDGFFEMLPG